MPVVQRRSDPAVWSEAANGAPSGDRVGWSSVALFTVCLGVAIGLLGWLGDGRLATPAVTDPLAWREWATTVEPVVVTAALLRLGALGLAWYLTGVTSIAVLARGLRAVRLARLAVAVSVGPVKVLVQQVVGLGLATAVLATITPAGPPAAGVTDRLVMVEVADDTPTPVPSDGPWGRVERGTGRSVATGSAPTGAARGETVEATEPPVPAPADGQAGHSVGGGEVWAAADPGSPDGPRERRIDPGDHFWSIAAEEVEAHLGRSGTEAEVRLHWAVLLDANADRLVVSGNPDLLLPGQHIVLPDVEGGGP